MPSNRFSELVDQPRVAEFLGKAVDEGRVSHAYLFTGTDTDGMERAAEILAEAVVMAPEDAGRFDITSYPDYHADAPASFVGYLADQIRDLIETANLTPIRGNGKFFLLNEADRLYGTAANALLKTLEEPPADVTFVLCTRDADSVLPTLTSRCQAVPFSNVDSDVVCSRVAGQAGVPAEDARFVLEFTTGPRDAVECLQNSRRMEVIAAAMDLIGELKRLNSWDSLKRVDDLVKKALERASGLKESQEEELERYADFLSAGSRKDMEKRFKRDIAAFERSCVRELVAAVEAVLRDALVARETGNDVCAGECERRALDGMKTWTSSEVLGALESCAEALDNLRHGATIESVVEAMVLKMRGTVCP